MKANKYIIESKSSLRYSLEWEIKDGRFSMCGDIWCPHRKDSISGGQNIEEIAQAFPGNAKVQRMAAIWREWHLNDMQAGSPAQMAFLKANPVTDRLNHYASACEALRAAGLQPDPNYIHDGKPYKYGSAWLKKELPPEVIEEIGSWSER